MASFIATENVSVSVADSARWSDSGLRGGGDGRINGSSLGRRSKTWLRVLLLIVASIFSQVGRAELQFDVFLGHDDRVREGHWFPIAFEILNDGPAFTGTVIVGTEIGFDTNPQRFDIELPTGTRKRAVITAFPSSGRYARWEARLLDPTGKVIAERGGLLPKDSLAHVPILGAIPRTFGGLPTLPEVQNRGPEYVPNVARLQAEYLPSNPIALESLTAWYLNSERAADLKPDQADALLAWLHAGGHLIVALEQPTDVLALDWLRETLPFRPTSVTNLSQNGDLDRWVRSGTSPNPTVGFSGLLSAPQNSTPRPPSPGRAARRRTNSPTPVPASAGTTGDPYQAIESSPAEFQKAEFPLILGHVTDGNVLLEFGKQPVIVSAPRGRGTVTVLAFSPEREPFRSWKGRPWFWARVVGIEPDLLQEGDLVRWGGTSLDGLFGAMLDSRQVRKLPIAALLLLLVVYLAVIGPIDQWVLKRLKRQMWTWVTFPTYVLIFSALIYFIGYKLRAGELEWNELQVVDQLTAKDNIVLRGRTWVSIYSPANARYRIASEQPFATFRAELQQGAQGRADSSQLSLKQTPKGFDANAFIPVWVNQLYVSDWLSPGARVLSAEWRTDVSDSILKIVNHSDIRLPKVMVAFRGRLYDLGELQPQGQLEGTFGPEAGQSLDELVGTLPTLVGRVQQRRFAFGNQDSGRIERDLNGVVLASLSQRLSVPGIPVDQTFAAQPTFDLERLLRRGDALVFAWGPGVSIAPPIHRFSPSRLSRDTVLRLTVPPRP